MQKAFAAMDALEKGADRQSRREPHGRPLLAARAGTGPDAGDSRGDPPDRRPRSSTSRPGFTPEAIKPREGCPVHAGALDRHRRLGAGADVRRRRPGRSGRPTGCSSTSSTTPTPTASPASSHALDGRLDETLVVVITKSGGTPETRNGMLVVADAYRKAGTRFRPARRRRHRGRLEAGPAGRRRRAGWRGSRCGTGSAAAPASCRPSACVPGSCRASTSTACSPAPPPWTSPPASTTPRRTPPRCWP